MIPPTGECQVQIKAEEKIFKIIDSDFSGIKADSGRIPPGYFSSIIFIYKLCSAMDDLKYTRIFGGDD